MKPYRLLISFVLTASIIIASLLDGSAFDISETTASWSDSESASVSASAGTSFVQAISRSSRSNHVQWDDYRRGVNTRVNFRTGITYFSWSNREEEGANILIRNDPETNNMRNNLRSEDMEVRYEHLHGVRMEDDFRWELYYLTGDLRATNTCVSDNFDEIRENQQLVAYSDNLTDFTPVSDVLIGNEVTWGYRVLCFIVEHKGNNVLTNRLVSRDHPTAFDGTFFVDFNTSVGPRGEMEWSQRITAQIAMSNVR